MITFSLVEATLRKKFYSVKILISLVYLIWFYLLPNTVFGLPSQSPLLCTINPIGDDAPGIHAEPNPLSKKIGIVPYHAHSIQKLDETDVDNNTWYQVSYQNMIGWVNAQYLLCLLSPAEAKKIIDNRAQQVIQLVKKQDFIQLAFYVHPKKGIRFSPYAYVEPYTDLILTASKLKNLVNDHEKYLWGNDDGSGEQISLSFSEYYKRFIYDHDFAHATKIVYNTSVKSGNTRNNMREVYPNAIIVEYHFPGFDPNFKGDDWSSLRLVFEAFHQQWYLVGVIHDQRGS